MHKKAIYLSLFFIGFFLVINTSCGKYAGDVNADLIGLWNTDTVNVVDTGEDAYNYIRIDGDNSAYGFLCDINCSPCGCFALFVGPATINRKRTKLKIGTSELKTTLKIQEEPFIDDNGNWKMKVDDSYYYKQ